MTAHSGETTPADTGAASDTSAYPDGHGDAHKALSWAKCVAGTPHTGCNMIDFANGTLEIDGEKVRIVTLHGEAHRRALAAVSQTVVGACATCPWRTGEWKESSGTSREVTDASS